MSGTNYSSGGFRGITRLVPPVKMRFFGFIVVVIGGGLLLTWITHNTWDQLDRLQREHAAVKSESFYLGVTLRGSIRSLNDKVLDLSRVPDPTVLSNFFRESVELKQLMATNRYHLTELAKLPLLQQLLVDDFDILDRMDKEYEHYLAQAVTLLKWNQASGTEPSFQDRYNQVRRASIGLLGLCDELVRAQREDFSSFLAETKATLVNHQRLLEITLGLIVGLAGALASSVYRGMIAPLRVGLHQSQTIIERQEKLASLGVLASGVAHEIRNPLTALKMRLFSLKRANPAIAENEDLGIISNEINRLERIVKDFLQFARPSEPELAPVPAGRILQQVCDLLKPQLERSDIELKMQADADIWIRVDAQQIKQVLINLVQNSAENIGSLGAITLHLHHETAEWDGQTQSAAILAVADTGNGIPPEVEKRLFDPFFTTKEGGTGLGLAISARILQKHGGLLRYKTQLSRGTVFEILLPEVNAHAAELVTY